METLLAAAQPPMDGPYLAALLSRVLHTTCAATLLGGLIYLRFVLEPAAGEGDPVEKLYAGRRAAWSKCVALCSALLLASGIYNLLLVTRGYPNLPEIYHPLFGVKFLLALVVMLVTSFLAGKTTMAERMRAKRRMWLNVAVACALGVFALSATLRSFRDLPESRNPPADEAPAFGEEAGGVEIEIE